MSDGPDLFGTGEDGDDNDRSRRRKQRDRPPASGLAKLSLGISLFVAATGFLYFYVQGQYTTAIGVGLVFALGGLWEYRRRLQDAMAEQRYEAEAEKHSHRKRR